MTSGAASLSMAKKIKFGYLYIEGGVECALLLHDEKHKSEKGAITGLSTCPLTTDGTTDHLRTITFSK